jgi:hypothetical protein
MDAAEMSNHQNIRTPGKFCCCLSDTPCRFAPCPHRPTTRPAILSQRVPPHEKLTNFGSLGLPSSPTPAFLNFSCMTNLLPSSNPTPIVFIILNTSFFPCSSNPLRLSPASMFAARSKLLLCNPAAASSWNEPTGWYLKREKRRVQDGRESEEEGSPREGEESMEKFGVRIEKRRDQEEGIGGSWERICDGRRGIQ